MKEIPADHEISAAESPSENHALEVLLVLRANCDQSGIAAVHVVLDDGPDSAASSTARLRSAVAHASSRFAAHLVPMRSNHSAGGNTSDRPLRKIRASVFSRQPTYAELFRFAEELPHVKSSAVSLRRRSPKVHLVALANADIFLRNSELLDTSSFLSDAAAATPRRPLALTLTSSALSGGCGPDSCSTAPQGWSWDVTIFAVPFANPLNYSMLESLQPFPVYMNALGAENRVGLMLSAAKYELRNPCHVIQAVHVHCATKTHARLLDHAGVGGPPVMSADAKRNARSGGGGGRAAAARVDAAVEDELVAERLAAAARAAGGLRRLPRPISTRLFWVQRCDGGRGVRDRLE